MNQYITETYLTCKNLVKEPSWTIDQKIITLNRWRENIILNSSIDIPTREIILGIIDAHFNKMVGSHE